MLCPEVWNFPPPKIVSSYRPCEDIQTVINNINLNYFYKSIIITLPDELNIPNDIKENILEDSDYYEVRDCALSEFVDPCFIDNFVKKGSLNCLSAERNCMVQNCATVTPDGVLILHILDFIFQTLGLEGVKRPHNYYEIKIDLKLIKNVQKVKTALQKLEMFNFYLSWVPYDDNVCPSSVAKYFCDKNLSVSVHSLKTNKLTPNITQIPSLIDSEIDEVVEWIGMLALGCDLTPKEDYISTYSEPESTSPIQSNRISLYIVKGFLTSNIIVDVCEKMKEFVSTRDIENYWCSLSIQSHEESLWQWSTSTPRMFQSHNSSCNIFFTQNEQKIYSIGELKYS